MTEINKASDSEGFPVPKSAQSSSAQDEPASQAKDVTLSSISEKSTMATAMGMEHPSKRVKKEAVHALDNLKSTKDSEVHPDAAPSAVPSADGAIEEPMLVAAKVEVSTSKIPRPTPAECKYVTEELESLHPEAVRAHRESRKRALEDRGDGEQRRERNHADGEHAQRDTPQWL